MVVFLYSDVFVVLAKAWLLLVFRPWRIMLKNCPAPMLLTGFIMLLRIVYYASHESQLIIVFMTKGHLVAEL